MKKSGLTQLTEKKSVWRLYPNVMGSPKYLTIWITMIMSTLWQSCIFIEALISRTRQGVYEEVLQQPELIYFIPSPPRRCGPTRAMAPTFTRFLDHTQRRITVGRTPLDEWSARRRQHTILTTNINAPGRIRTQDLSRRAAADLRLRPRGHWDRPIYFIRKKIIK